RPRRWRASQQGRQASTASQGVLGRGATALVLARKSLRSPDETRLRFRARRPSLKPSRGSRIAFRRDRDAWHQVCGVTCTEGDPAAAPDLSTHTSSQAKLGARTGRLWPPSAERISDL